MPGGHAGIVACTRVAASRLIATDRRNYQGGMHSLCHSYNSDPRSISKSYALIGTFPIAVVDVQCEPKTAVVS
jgi:hypothetical protein